MSVSSFGENDGKKKERGGVEGKPLCRARKMPRGNEEKRRGSLGRRTLTGGGTKKRTLFPEKFWLSETCPAAE
jgi:hypothetical protein